MDGDLGARLESILSDPEQMEKLTQMAQGLFGQAAPAPEMSSPEGAAELSPPPIPGADTRFISALGKAFSGGGGKSRSTALLVAMRPYMKPEKQEKLDRAMQIARMVNIAGVVMREYGGGHGV